MFTFETKRLRLVNYTEDLELSVQALLTDSDVMKHVGDGAMSVDAANLLWKKLTSELYPQGNRTIWAVISTDDGRYVGHAAIRPRPTKSDEWEISYFLTKPEWGKGFATEIAAALVDYGFRKLKLNEIFATIDDDHANSIKVVKKIGMQFLRYEYDDAGRFSVYSIKR